MKIMMSDNMARASRWGLEVRPNDAWSSLYYSSFHELHSIPLHDIENIWLAGIRSRFEELRSKLPILDKLSAEQGVSRIDKINDAAKLLFQHSVYKSYPISFVEKCQFDRLTKWLGGLTTVDLSNLDLTGLETIDDWIDLLDAETAIRIVHSSGTSGKLSFLPRSTLETDLSVQNWRLIHEDAFASLGSEAPKMEEVPIIFPGYRTGGMAMQRMLNRVTETVFGGDRAMLVALNDSRMSADALALGGRLQVNQQRGEFGEVRLSSRLRAQRDELISSITDAQARMTDFIANLAKSHGGRSVAMMVMIGQLYDIAVAASKEGLTRIFSPRSNLMFGGGWKGRTEPENWKETISEFLGVEDLRMSYGMTEGIAGSRACERGHYHLFPFQIPFVLDPVTGTPYPRQGTQTGRFGMFDLGASTYWGGFLTGDKVTLSYETCACGRTTPWLQGGEIRRYTEEEGGDDKITCAGAPEAHDNALAYLLASVEN